MVDFLQLVGAFFIGAVTGSVITLLIPAIFKYWARRSLYQNQTKLYSCSEPGLSHSFGKKVPDATASDGYAWEHSNDPTYKLDQHGVPLLDANKNMILEEGLCTIYGPYTNDFYEPGMYKVTFKIRFDGIRSDDKKVVMLDVVRWSNNIEYLVKQLELRGEELSRDQGSYRDHVLECIVGSTEGRFEYRADVAKELFQDGKRSIRFDRITVARCFRLRDAFL